MFILVKDIVKIMSEMAPARLAEDWDNVGLQVGRYEKEVRVILCALDFSAEVLEQAAQLHADIIVTHHPAIFRGIKKLTDRDWRTALLKCEWFFRRRYTGRHRTYRCSETTDGYNCFC